MSARGVVYVHSCPPAIRPHVEWALARVFGAPVRLDWAPQPAAPGQLRAVAPWRGQRGSASRVAAALRGWAPLRFEVTEEPTAGSDGERYALTPELGLFTTTMSANGDVLVQEDRLRSVLAGCHDLAQVRVAMDGLLGGAWDRELEPFRQAGDDTPPRSLTKVG